MKVTSVFKKAVLASCAFTVMAPSSFSSQSQSLTVAKPDVTLKSAWDFSDFKEEAEWMLQQQEMRRDKAIEKYNHFRNVTKAQARNIDEAKQNLMTILRDVNKRSIYLSRDCENLENQIMYLNHELNTAIQTAGKDAQRINVSLVFLEKTVAYLSNVADEDGKKLIEDVIADMDSYAAGARDSVAVSAQTLRKLHSKMQQIGISCPVNWDK